MLGYLRENSAKISNNDLDYDTKIKRSGLDEYLNIIFPDVDDWIYDRQFGGQIKELSRKRPDYRSEKLKLIIEFDGLDHYTNPQQIKIDKERVFLYQKYGYSVIRIPYFIQLSKNSVKQLFNVDCYSDELFDESIPSLTIHSKSTPAFLCLSGIKRMAEEFKKFPAQYNTNINYLKSLSTDYDYINGWEMLDFFYKELE